MKRNNYKFLLPLEGIVTASCSPEKNIVEDSRGDEFGLFDILKMQCGEDKKEDRMKMEKTCEYWMSKLPEDKRQKFSDRLFSVFSELHGASISFEVFYQLGNRVFIEMKSLSANNSNKLCVS